LEAGPEASVAETLRRVEILAQRGALAEAEGLLAQIKTASSDRLDEENRMKLLKLEARLAVAEGVGGEAVDVLEEIVALNPLDGEALMLLGGHYAGNGESDRAIFYYERAGSIEEYEADAKIRQAQVLVEMSKYGEAVPLLERAQELEPREDVARYLEQVERVARGRR
jgi:Flp pilus assembly protein TadD